MQVDHVIYAVSDLEEAAERFRRAHGLSSYAGGSHPSWGTANRLIPMGDDYLELVGIFEPETAAMNPFGQMVAAAIEAGERPVGWAVRTDDVEAVAARLGISVVPGERVTPGGGVVRWRAAGLVEALNDRSRPFFITWDDMEMHPARTVVAHENSPRRIAWIEVGGDQATLDTWLASNALPVRANGDEPGIHAFAVATALGEIVFR